MSKKKSKKQIALITWVIIATLYTLLGLWTSFRVQVMQASYNKGRLDAATQVLQEASKCQPFPINIGENTANLIAVECLQKPEDTAEPATE